MLCVPCCNCRIVVLIAVSGVADELYVAAAAASPAAAADDAYADANADAVVRRDTLLRFV